MPTVGELVQTTAGKWITHPPTRCPNGHVLGPNQVLVGHVVCLGHGGGGHTSWHCRTCDAVVYGPPMNTHCAALEGPAAVRISTSRDAIAADTVATGDGTASSRKLPNSG
jgi:hypothetical protein